MKNHLIPNPELPISYAGFPCSGLFSSVSEPCSVSREPFFHSSFSDFNFPFSDSFGFNGQEKDDEIYGEGASLSFEFRNYDSRIGRFWSVDPVLKNHESPYATFSGNPINRIDPEGMTTEEPETANDMWQKLLNEHNDNNAWKDIGGKYGNTPQKGDSQQKPTFEQLIDSKLSNLNNGGSITGKELGEVLGIEYSITTTKKENTTSYGQFRDVTTVTETEKFININEK